MAEPFGAGEFPAGEAPAGEGGESPGSAPYVVTLIELWTPQPYTVVEPQTARPFTLIEEDAMRTIEAGNAITLTFLMRKGETPYPVEVDPNSADILIQRPDGQEVVSLTNLTRLSLGRFQYVHQTNPTDQIGTWTVACKVTRDGRVNWKTSEAFILVKGQAS